MVLKSLGTLYQGILELQKHWNTSGIIRKIIILHIFTKKTRKIQ